MQTQEIQVSLLEMNEGQIAGLPRNPRFIRDEKYDKLKQSIEEAPEMLQMRSLIVVEHDKKYIVICGNMRLKACVELGYETLPCYILPQDTPTEKLREYTMKDNIAYGETDWERIAEDWDELELENWGMDLTQLNNGEWEQMADITGEHEAPVAKGVKIVVELSLDEKDRHDEIKQAIEEAVSEYDVTVR